MRTTSRNRSDDEGIGFPSTLFLDLHELTRSKVAIRVTPAYLDSMVEHLRFHFDDVFVPKRTVRRAVEYRRDKEGSLQCGGDWSFVEVSVHGSLRDVTARLGAWLMAMSIARVPDPKNA